jgi:hypothetical protein
MRAVTLRPAVGTHTVKTSMQSSFSRGLDWGLIQLHNLLKRQLAEPEAVHSLHIVP